MKKKEREKNLLPNVIIIVFSFNYKPNLAIPTAGVKMFYVVVTWQKIASVCSFVFKKKDNYLYELSVHLLETG